MSYALAQTPEECAALPSGRAAFDLVHGDPKAAVPVVGYTLLRSLLIAGGLYVAGEREHLMRNAIAGAIGIEVYVLLWAALQPKWGAS